jgi:hypothetical protein
MTRSMSDIMKTAARRAMASAMVALAALSLVAVEARPQHADSDSANALGVFHERINAYATLHRDVASHFLPLVPSEDPHTFLATQSALASAIRAARPTARQGDIFIPAVATVFRQTIGYAVCGRDVEAMLHDDEEPPALDRGRLHVLDPYPTWATHAVPAILLQRLPSLPEGIMYRLVDPDLLLWDADANLIVDILSDATSAAAMTLGGCARV